MHASKSAGKTDSSSNTFWFQLKCACACLNPCSSAKWIQPMDLGLSFIYYDKGGENES